MSFARDKAKDKAKRFFHKIVNSREHNESDSSPPPPLKSDNDLYPEFLNSFNALDVSGSHRPSRTTDFIGGFNPGTLVTNYSSNVSTPNPSMPTPFIPSPVIPAGQSLTMTMALQPEGSSVKPSPKPNVPWVWRPENTASIQAVSASPVGNTSTSASPKPPRKRVTSSPAVSQSESNSSTSLGRQQCAGITKVGKRCTRQVKLGAYLVPVQTEMPSGEWEPEVFCFQHLKELMGPSGFYSRKDGTWVEFADWIPAYLQTDTQVALRVEMEKTKSPSDVPGYIYAFEIRDPDAKDTVKLKVGRAVNLVKRIDQWEKQCGSKEQVLRGYYPGPAGKPDGDSRDDSLMKGRLKAGDVGPWCHRMERLIHLELADLSASSIHLVPSWPNVSPQIGSPSPSASMKRSVSASAAPEPCPDCGSLHKEIFEFKRFKGRLQGQEWESVVQPVIHKWGSFVAQYV